MLPLWVFIALTLLALFIVFLLWRLRNCKCSLYETFETKGEGEADTDAKDDADAKTNTKADTETEAKANTDETDTEATPAEVETKKPSKEVVEEDTEATAPEAKKKKESTMADKFMNYGEMKLFDNLRDNAYSLQDIKRMIREGEITEKMIEKFLARVEKMEDRVQGKPDATKTTVEGFSGGRAPMYASAAFS